MNESNIEKAPFLTLLLLLIFGFSALLVVLLACGGGVGWVLHRFWPSIETGTSMLIGVVASAFAAQLFVKTIGSLITEAMGGKAVVTENVIDGDDDEDDDPPIYITNLPPDLARRYTPARRRTKRRR